LGRPLAVLCLGGAYPLQHFHSPMLAVNATRTAAARSPQDVRHGVADVWHEIAGDYGDMWRSQQPS